MTEINWECFSFSQENKSSGSHFDELGLNINEITK